VLARIDIVSGRIEEGLRDGMRAAREARDAGFESVGVTGYRNLAIMAARVMNPQAARIAIGEGLQYADAIEQSHCRQMMATTTALMEWAAGHWDAADALARQELVDRGCRRGTVGALDVLGLVALGRGRLDDARRWLGESLSAGRRMNEVSEVLTPLWALAEVDLRAGNVDSAVARCREALELATRTEERALLIPFVVTGTRAMLAAHRPEDAERWVADARAALTPWNDIAGPALAHAEGLVAMSTGSLSAGREALSRAVAGWTEHERVWEASWARLDLAACLMRSNRFADAATQLAAVREFAHDVASEPLLSRVEELARVARGRGSIDEPWRPLTAREFEVAKLIARGMTNGEIAAELTIAPKTASAHVEHILAKLGVTRRTEIAAWVAAIGAGTSSTTSPEAVLAGSRG
jgi:DNA-binding CsgD family transcriptional regulator